MEKRITICELANQLGGTPFDHLEYLILINTYPALFGMGIPLDDNGEFSLDPKFLIRYVSKFSHKRIDDKMLSQLLGESPEDHQDLLLLFSVYPFYLGIRHDAVHLEDYSLEPNALPAYERVFA